MKENISKVRQEECFGCSACMSICISNAIKMLPDKEGFMSPVVNEEKCTNCGACQRVCPAINVWKSAESNNKFYAFQNTNKDTLKKSTSGGAFSEIVNQIRNPYICGCVIDDNLYIKHILSRKKADIESMRGSKYVQSDMSDCFKQIREKLLNNENVVFTGLSCQTHGLLNYLRMSDTPVKNLITIDLICHGVPSNLMHLEYIKNYEKQKHKKILSHFFRTKRQNWKSYFILRNYEQILILHNNKIDRMSLASQLWINVFFSDLCLRECCYQCPYCCESKPADITMADFWGIEETDINLNFSLGCSLLIARGKGEDFVQKLLNIVALNNKQKETAKKYQLHLSKPTKRPNNKDDFWQDYYKHGFSHAAKKYLRYGFKYKILMLAFNVFNIFKNKRFAQKIGNKLFY